MSKIQTSQSGQQTSLFHPPFAVGLAVIVLLTLSALQNHYRAGSESGTSGTGTAVSGASTIGITKEAIP